MSDYGEWLERGKVRFRRTLPGPIERVWAYLTESDKRARWFCAGETEPRVGGRLELRFHHALLSEEEDVAPTERYADMPEQMSSEGRVTRYEAPHTLAFEWKEESGYSEVCIDLEERADEVVLTLTHTKLSNRDEEIGVSGGWHTHLDILEDELRARPRRAFWRHFNSVDAEYRARIPE